MNANDIQNDWNEIFNKRAQARKDYGDWLDENANVIKVASGKGYGSCEGRWTKTDLDGDLIWMNDTGTDGKAASSFYLFSAEIVS